MQYVGGMQDVDCRRYIGGMKAVCRRYVGVM